MIVSPPSNGRGLAQATAGGGQQLRSEMRASIERGAKIEEARAERLQAYRGIAP